MTKLFTSDITNQKYTSKEFLRLIEKRIRKHFRIEKTINIKEKYFLLNDHSANFEINKYFLEVIFNNRLEIEGINSIQALKTNNEKLQEPNIIFNFHLEEFIGTRLEVFFKDKEINNLKKIIAPLRVISQEEMKQLCEILKIKKPLTKTNNYFIEELQKIYSQTKNSLLKSFDAIAERFSENKS